MSQELAVLALATAEDALEAAKAATVRAMTPGPMDLRGPQGDAGPVGPQGPDGPRGDVGPIGPRGETGEAGRRGPMGPQGTAGDPGRDGLGITWRGAWSESVTYFRQDAVSHAGGSWIATDTNIDSPPGTGATWNTLAEPGKDGKPGKPGDRGPQGPGGVSITSGAGGGGDGVSDHGDLTGLSDDDHSQYHNDSRGDARYPQRSNNLSDLSSVSTARTNLGLGTAATSATGDFESSGAVSTHAALTSGVHGISAFAATVLDDTTAAAARTTLGLGTAATAATGDFDAAGAAAAAQAASQPLDADLTAIAGLTSAANKGIQFTGSGTAGTYDLTTAGKALLDDADASAQRTTLGLGGAAVLSVGTTAGTVAAGDDARLSDTRTPTDATVTSAKLTGSITFPARTIPKVVALTDAATIATDASLGNHFTVTLAGNRTLGNPTNPVDGQMVLYVIRQDATGSRTLAFGADFRATTDVALPTLSTAAAKTDYIGFRYNGTDSKWDCLSVVKG
jgi:hypothetical protein